MSPGKTALTDLSKSDLCSLDPFISKATEIQLEYISPENQQQFWGVGINSFEFNQAQVQNILRSELN